MYLELVDALRCTRAHDESPLIAAVSRRADRDIVTGMLGCPICLAEYPIEDGVAIFGDGLAGPRPESPDRDEEPPDQLAVRCAAMLGLYDAGGIVVLGGAWGIAASDLLELSGALVVLLEPPAGARVGHGIAAVRAGADLPFAPASLRGVALDERTSTRPWVRSAARALKRGGRLIAGVTAELPPDVVERARDDRHWVAELEAAASAPVQLLRSRPGIRGPDANEGA